jgi:hypothetical protein
MPARVSGAGTVKGRAEPHEAGRSHGFLAPPRPKCSTQQVFRGSSAGAGLHLRAWQGSSRRRWRSRSRSPPKESLVARKHYGRRKWREMKRKEEKTRLAQPTSQPTSPARSSLPSSLEPVRPCPVDTATAVAGALRWSWRRTWGCGWCSSEERGGGGGGAVGSISPPFFPSLTPSCCFLARRPGRPRLLERLEA